MISLQVDEKEFEIRYLEELRKRLDRLEHSRTLWDMKELCRQTCMSENNIKEKFFYEERFPKRKIGGKWYFPAKATEEFLISWINEQPSS
jgi:hypothetical protein